MVQCSTVGLIPFREGYTVQRQILASLCEKSMLGGKNRLLLFSQLIDRFPIPPDCPIPPDYSLRDTM